MTTILIATLVLWTVFGMFVLFSLPDDLSIKNVSLLKLVLALGPVIVLVGVIGAGMFKGVDKTITWLNRK
jgi:hypothetical protein